MVLLLCFGTNAPQVDPFTVGRKRLQVFKGFGAKMKRKKSVACAELTWALNCWPRGLRHRSLISFPLSLSPTHALTHLVIFFLPHTHTHTHTHTLFCVSLCLFLSCYSTIYYLCIQTHKNYFSLFTHNHLYSFSLSLFVLHTNTFHTPTPTPTNTKAHMYTYTNYSAYFIYTRSLSLSLCLSVSLSSWYTLVIQV